MPSTAEAPATVPRGTPPVSFPPEICERAYRSGDARFDGRFFVGVRTTGIYCRPVCPVKPPKPENVDFYPSAAAAAEAGLRPCLRCRPELGAGTPEWTSASTTVNRALRLISEQATEGDGVATIAERLGVTPRHLRRLFNEHLGASPNSVLRTQRIHLAKRLIDDTDLRFADVAFAAGFGSVRRFNATFSDLYGRTPGELRRLAHGTSRRPSDARGEYVFRLAYRPPFDWKRLLAFFAVRATAGVEEVDSAVYRRTFRSGDEPGILEVRRIADRAELEARIAMSDAKSLLRVVGGVRRLFDLGADPEPIRRHLALDPALRPALGSLPGLRVPGAWDGFELLVRAIVGQQVSVKGATTVMGRIAERWGAPLPEPRGALSRLAPRARDLADAELESAGMPRARAETIRLAARVELDGRLPWHGGDPEVLRQALVAIPGIGEWTAQYVTLRLGDPDAFPASDLGLLRSAANGGAKTPVALAERAERWRPWRAYAALLLWNTDGGSK